MSSSPTAPQQRRTPPSPGSPPRKRAKRGTSCLDCRRRKLKCDGQRPICTRCIKGGVAASCTYDANAPVEYAPEPASVEFSVTQPEVRTAPPIRFHPPQQQQLTPATTEWATPAQDGAARLAHKPGDAAYTSNLARLQDAKIERLEQKISQLTDVVTALSSAQPNAGLDKATHPVLTPHDPLNRPADDGPGVALPNSKGFRTYYWGPSHPMSITAEFDVLSYYNEGFLSRHPMLFRALKDIKIQDKRRKARMKAKETLNQMQLLHELLPAREVIDPLVALYLETIENVYHVLHVPKFFEQYEKLWAYPLSQSDPNIVTTVLLMSAAVLCVPEQGDVSFLGETTVNRDTAQSWVLCCEKWIQMQSEKHLTVTNFQHRCLLLIAKFMGGIKLKRWYHESSALVAFATSVGLHLDPRRISWNKHVSEFDTEMRRRIWAAVVELNFQATFHRGLPPTLETLAPDTSPPLNVNDSELDPAITNLKNIPVHRGFCPISALVHRASTWKLRMQILTLANRPNVSLSSAEFWDLEDQLFQLIKALPQWESSELPSDLESTVAFTRAHMELELKHLLLLLYRKASKDKSHSGLQRAGKMGCLDTCANIIKQHHTLTKTQSFIISSLTGDVVAAAINLCYDLSTYEFDTDTSSVFRRTNITQMLDLVEDAISTFALRLMRIGGVYRRYWVLLSAQAAVQGKMFPERADAFDKITAEKVANMIYKMLSLQAMPLDDGTFAGVASDADKRSSIEPSNSQSLHQAMAQSSSIDDLNPHDLGLPSLDSLSLPSWDWDSVFDM